MKIGKITDSEITITITLQEGKLIDNCMTFAKMKEFLQDISFSKNEIKTAEAIGEGFCEIRKKLKEKKLKDK